jgi:hypothetical protein
MPSGHQNGRRCPRHRRFRLEAGRPPAQRRLGSPSPDRDHRGSTKPFWHCPGRAGTRDRNHVQHVAKRPCLICGRQPCDAHHLRFSQSRALGVSDEFTVPLCRGHHREVHGCGDEVTWWRKSGIDLTVVARVLWLETHPLLSGPGSALADVENSQTTRAGEGTRAKTDGRKGGRRANRKTKSVKDAVSYPDRGEPSRQEPDTVNLASTTAPVRKVASLGWRWSP